MSRWDAVRRRFPRSGELPGERGRHGRLVLVVGAHLPLLAAAAAVRGELMAPAGAGLLGLAALLAGAVPGGSQRVRSVTLGLACGTTSALVDALSGGMLGSLHGVVILGAVATLIDWWAWWPALAAVVAVALSSADLPLALSRAVLVLLAAVGQLWWWRLAEREIDSRRLEAERREHEERAVVQELREAARIRTELIAVVGHEFRTPLTAIRGFAKTLLFRRDQLDDDTVQVCLQTIDEQAARLERIVANVLLASDRYPQPEAVAVDLAESVQAVASEVQPAASAHGVPIRVSTEPGTGVRLHQEPLRAIVLNLLDNAVTFADPGSEVSVEVRPEGDFSVLRVANRGCPIQAADLTRIFEPFVQADSSDTRAAPGIGLGLHVVRRLAESHGGSAEARNDAGLVVFTVRLPSAAQRDT